MEMVKGSTSKVLCGCVQTSSLCCSSRSETFPSSAFFGHFLSCACIIFVLLKREINPRRCRTKQEELKALAQPQRYDIIGISKNCCNESCDWCARKDGYRLFRWDRQGRRGGEVGVVCNGGSGVNGAYSWQWQGQKPLGKD